MPRLATVFGGSGFIGRHLIRRLAAAGVRVRAAVRHPERAGFLKPMGDVGQIVPVLANVRDEGSVRAALEGADAAVNLVGILYESGRQTFDAVHVEAAGRIARVAREAGVARLVHLSALGADRVCASDYARTKALGEEAVRAAFPEAAIFRPSVVFGPEDAFLNRFAVLMRDFPVFPVFYEGLIPRLHLEGLYPVLEFDWGANRMQPIYVGDLAEAIEKALDAGGLGGKTYELGGPVVYRMREIIGYVADLVGRRPLFVPLPFFAAEVVAGLLELLPEPPLTADQVKLLRRDNVVHEGMPGIGALGIAPTAMEVIAPAYLARYRRRPRALRETG